jgi:periplasmic divalent cation tolerance protein
VTGSSTGVSPNDGEIVVLVTAGTSEEAAGIGHAVVEAGLAACANILPGVRSIFRWEGKIAEEGEVLILLKSRASLFDALAATIRQHHSYSVPEIIALPILLGSRDYLAWIRQVTEVKNC